MYQFLIGILAGGIATVLLTRPARINNVRLEGIRPASDGHGTRASVTWTYGAGARPVSLIVDIASDTGIRGSATADIEQRNVFIPFPSAAAQRYTITTTATYRIMGIARVNVRTFKRSNV